MDKVFLRLEVKMREIGSRVLESLEVADACDVAINIAKIFYIANKEQICQTMLKDESIMQFWMQYFKYIIDLPVQIEDEKHQLWKLKAIAAKIVYKFFLLYSNKES